jgi:hypothetical protein
MRPDGVRPGHGLIDAQHWRLPQRQIRGRQRGQRTIAPTRAGLLDLKSNQSFKRNCRKSE